MPYPTHGARQQERSRPDFSSRGCQPLCPRLGQKLVLVLLARAAFGCWTAGGEDLTDHDATLRQVAGSERVPGILIFGTAVGCLFKQ
jgi:hypothetical protein